MPRRQHYFGVAVLLLLGPLALVILKQNPALDQSLLHSPSLHVLISGGASFLGAALALLVLRVAIRARDARVFFVGMGFLAVSCIFLIHSIATPNVLMAGRGAATQWSGVLSLVVGGVFFAISGIHFSATWSQRIIGDAGRTLALFLVCWAVYGGTVLLWEPLTSAPPVATVSAASHDDQAEEYGYGGGEHSAAQATTGSGSAPAEAETLLDAAMRVTRSIQLPLTMFGLVCYTVAAISHGSIYRAAPSAAGLAITVGIILLGQALLTQNLADVYTNSFWLYHLQEFTGFAVISYAVLVAYRHGMGSESFLEELFLGGTRARIRTDYTRGMDALVATLSRGEEATAELRHTLRSRLGISETQVQVLEHAASAVAQERRQRQELEQLNAELVRTQDARDQLTQMIVHDLKNPLTGLIGFLEILRMHHNSDDDRTLVEGALRSGRNLTGLIDDLLDVGKMEQGHLELNRFAISPRALLEECAAQMRGWGDQEQKNLRIEIADDLPAFEGDARLLRRVLLNLISNAIKHTPFSTTITLSAREISQPDGNAQIAISVADDGRGIPVELLPHIFDKYRSGITNTNGRQSSTGLGLTFCRLACEAHGGQITATSTPGHGATFTIYLPLEQVGILAD